MRLFDGNNIVMGSSSA